MYNYCVTYRNQDSPYNGLVNIWAQSSQDARTKFSNMYPNSEIIDVI